MFPGLRGGGSGSGDGEATEHGQEQGAESGEDHREEQEVMSGTEIRVDDIQKFRSYEQAKGDPFEKGDHPDQEWKQGGTDRQKAEKPVPAEEGNHTEHQADHDRREEDAVPPPHRDGIAVSMIRTHEAEKEVDEILPCHETLHGVPFLPIPAPREGGVGDSPSA